MDNWETINDKGTNLNWFDVLVIKAIEIGLSKLEDNE